MRAAPDESICFMTNEVPNLQGSIGIFIPGTATLASPGGAVPEPVSTLLLGTGLLALAIRRAIKI
jgi:hypothetical protein